MPSRHIPRLWPLRGRADDVLAEMAVHDGRTESSSIQSVSVLSGGSSQGYI